MNKNPDIITKHIREREGEEDTEKRNTYTIPMSLSLTPTLISIGLLSSTSSWYLCIIASIEFYNMLLYKEEIGQNT